MAAREIRVSPDGDAVAIRTDYPDDGNKAFALIHVEHGGAWVAEATVGDWTPVAP